VVLFLLGTGILYYVNANYADTESVSASPNKSLDSIFHPLVQSKKPFNVLLLGGDKVSQNSDTMMLANFDPETMKINIMSIPRDTMVKIKNKERKINYAYPSGGVDLAAKTVSELLDVNIKYYVFVDTAAFREVIDLLGGVDYYIPADMDYDDPTQNLHIHLKKGQQTLNGAQAEQFVRFRKPNRWNKEIRKYYDGSDIKRTEAQRNFIKELMRQKLNIQYLPKLTSVINTIFDNVETNFTLNEVIRMTSLVSKFNINNVEFLQMPGTTYDASPWYYLCDVNESRALMAEKFICEDSFVTVDVDLRDSYKKMKRPVAPKPAQSANNTQTDTSAQENPSNNDTSITGSDQDP
jgi:LCP family protein required for cell wall assembly